MEYLIDEKKKGLFVIVEQRAFNFWWFDSEKKWLVDMKNADELPYERDSKKLIEVFGLKESELVHGVNLTSSRNFPERSAGNKCFETFMKDVCSAERGYPEFVVFLLMSHGLKNGVFLLAHEGKEVNGQLVSGEPCCRHSPQEEVKEHTLSGECYGRHVVTDIIQKVNDRYPEIPKIFIFQCCRGVEDENLENSQASSSECTETELFIESQPDTLVFWGSTETYVSYALSDSGSLLIQSFCKAVRELQENKQLHENLLKKVKKMPNADSKSLVEQYLEEHREDMTGGWLMNVCQRATSLVTNKLLVEITLPKSDASTILTPVGDDGRIPHWNDPEKRREMCRGFFQCLGTTNSTIQSLVKKYANDEDMLWRMFQYIYYNIFIMEPNSDCLFGLEASLRAILDGVIRDIRKVYPAYKQQPHISSNLARKVSIIKILSTQGK